MCAMNRRLPVFPSSALLAAVSLLVVHPAPAENGAQAELDRSSAELAASLVLDRLATELVDKPTDGTSLYETMRDAPADYTDPAAAQTALRPAYEEAVRARYRDDACRLLDRLAAPRARTEAFDAAFLDAATRPSGDVLQKAVDTHYDTLFRAARERACKEQAEHIVLDLRPTEEEVESKSRSDLSALLSTRIAEAQKTRVFQENLRYIADSLVRPMLDEAYRQRDAQRHLAARATVAGIAPSAVAARLVEAVTQDIAKRRAEAAEKGGQNVVYDLFPSVRDVAAKTAAERAAAAYVAAVKRVAVPLDENKVRIALEADPAKHIKLADSLQAFEPGLIAFVADAATKLALEGAPAEEHEEYRNYLKGLPADAPASKAPAERVRSEFQPHLADIRRAFAQKDFETRFPALANGSWAPDADLVDEVCAEADYRKALEKWRELRGPRRFAEEESRTPMVEEETALLDQAVAAPFADAAEARAEQLRAADRAEPGVRKDVLALPEVPALEKIVEMLATAVRADWSAKRAGIIHFRNGQGDDGRYAALFPSVDAKILLLAKAMLDVAEQERAKKEVKPPEPEPKPELPPVPAADLEEVEMDCALVFDRRDDRIIVEVLIDGNPAGSYSCPHNPNDFRSEIEAFSNATTQAVLGSVQKAIFKNRVALKVRLSVKDPCIYYGAVNGISRGLRRSIRQFNDYVTGLQFEE